MIMCSSAVIQKKLVSGINCTCSLFETVSTAWNHLFSFSGDYFWSPAAKGTWKGTGHSKVDGSIWYVLSCHFTVHSWLFVLLGFPGGLAVLWCRPLSSLAVTVGLGTARRWPAQQAPNGPCQARDILVPTQARAQLPWTDPLDLKFI